MEVWALQTLLLLEQMVTRPVMLAPDAVAKAAAAWAVAAQSGTVA